MDRAFVKGLIVGALAAYVTEFFRPLSKPEERIYMWVQERRGPLGEDE